jgi:fucose permease
VTAPPAGRGAAPLVLASVAAFIGLGIAEGALGITFPVIRETFDVPLSALGLLLTPYTGGYLTATLVYSRLAGQVRIGRILIGAAACAFVGAALFAAGSAFAILMVGSFVLGTSAGSIDASLNSYASVHLPHRVLGFMHGGFGLGAALGPVAVVAILNAGWSWRVAYGALAAWHIGLGITWFLLQARFTDPATVDGSASADRDDVRTVASDDVAHTMVVGFEGDVAELAPLPVIGPDDARPRPGVVPLNIAMFFLYTGSEASTGLLIATLLVERGLSTETAGALTTAFWLSLTAGRFGTGAIGPRLSPTRALLIGSTGIVAGGVLVAFGGTTLAIPGLIVLGVCLGPFFPALVALTPARVGTRQAGRSIGLQLAAASIGVATVPSFISLIADHVGRAVIGPSLLAVALLLAAGHLVTGAAAGDLRPV